MDAIYYFVVLNAELVIFRALHGPKMPHCAAIGCIYSVKDIKEKCVSLHGFPRDKTWRKKWENACGRERLPKIPSLCSRHFSPDSFERRAQLMKELTGAGCRARLKPDAVPTIFPHRESKRPRTASENRAQKRQRQETLDALLLGGTTTTPPQPVDLDSLPAQSVLQVSVRHQRQSGYKQVAVVTDFKGDESVQCLPRTTDHAATQIYKDMSDAAVHFPADITHPVHIYHNYAKDIILDIAGNNHAKTCQGQDNTVLPQQPSPAVAAFESEPLSKVQDELGSTDTGISIPTLLISPEGTSFLAYANEAVPWDDPHSCTSDPESSAAEITEIIAFSDESDSSDEGQSSEVDDGDRDSDRDWNPPEHQDIHGELAESESDTEEEDNLDADGPVVLNSGRQLCPECGTFFRAQKAHTCEYKIKPYSCNVCGKRFSTERNQKIHKSIHKEGYKHTCVYCLSTFTTKPEKLAHEQRHLPAEKPYQCPDCPEVFAKMLERRDHLLSHRGPKTHICHICVMGFPRGCELERHMVVHTKAKQFVCEVCQRSFTQSCNLKSHMRVHTGEKPYQCKLCDKSFNHNVSLKGHIQRYHGTVPEPRMNVQMKETLCNAENAGDEEKEKESGCTKKRNRYNRLGRPRGRPKRNVDYVECGSP